MKRNAGHLSLSCGVSSVLHAPGPKGWCAMPVLPRLHRFGRPACCLLHQWRVVIEKLERHVSAALTFPAWRAGVVLFH